MKLWALCIAFLFVLDGTATAGCTDWNTAGLAKAAKDHLGVELNSVSLDAETLFEAKNDGPKVLCFHGPERVTRRVTNGEWILKGVVRRVAENSASNDAIKLWGSRGFKIEPRIGLDLVADFIIAPLTREQPHPYWRRVGPRQNLEVRKDIQETSRSQFAILNIEAEVVSVTGQIFVASTAALVAFDGDTTVGFLYVQPRLTLPESNQLTAAQLLMAMVPADTPMTNVID